MFLPITYLFYFIYSFRFSLVPIIDYPREAKVMSIIENETRSHEFRKFGNEAAN